MAKTQKQPDGRLRVIHELTGHIGLVRPLRAGVPAGRWWGGRGESWGDGPMWPREIPSPVRPQI